MVVFEWDEGKRARNPTGEIGGKFYSVVWTVRAAGPRLISFRRARDAEERAHRARFG